MCIVSYPVIGHQPLHGSRKYPMRRRDTRMEESGISNINVRSWCFTSDLFQNAVKNKKITMRLGILLHAWRHFCNSKSDAGSTETNRPLVFFSLFYFRFNSNQQADERSFRENNKGMLMDEFYCVCDLFFFIGAICHRGHDKTKQVSR